MRAAFAAGAKKSGAAAVAEFKHDGGYASLAGRFRLAGAPPRRSPINDRINKDVEVCAPAGRTVLSERLIVDEATGGIANVVLYLKSEPGRNVPIHESAARPREGAPAVLDNKACLFVPHVLAVHRGIGALTIANSDQVAHNANVAAEKGTVENRQIAPGGRTTYELTAEESKPVAVTCTVHTWMKGYLLPRDNGYFAVTDREGRFEIPNLPAGDVLTILVWHEATGNRGTGDFLKDFKVASEAVKPAKQGFTVTLAKDKPLSLEFEVPAAAFPAP
jgi:plastocyanin